MTASKWAESSFHGPPLVAGSQTKKAKAFWVFVILLSCLMFCYEGYAILVQYRVDPIAVKIRSRTPSKWPNVLFCPKNWLNKDKLPELGMSQEVKCFVIGSMSALTNTMHEYFMLQCGTYVSRGWLHLSEAFNSSQWANRDVLQLLANISYNVDDIFYLKDAYTIVKEVSYKGVCFNIALNVPFTLFGDAGKPTIYMKEQANALEGSPVGTDDIFLFDTLDTIEFLDMPKIKTSESPLILMKEEEYHRIQIGDAKCSNRTNSERMKIMVGCMENACIDAGLKPPFVPGYNFNDTKKLNYYANHLNPLKHCYYYPEVTRNIVEKCFGEMSPSCKSTTYLFSTYPTNDPKFNEDVGRRVPVITFGYYNSWSSQVVNEFRLYTWDTLLCNLGGMLSLFTGASLLSLVQLVVLCFPTKKDKIGDADEKPIPTVVNRGKNVQFYA